MMNAQEQSYRRGEHAQEVSHAEAEQRKVVPEAHEDAMTKKEREEAVAHAMKGLMERLGAKVDKRPSLKVALVTLALLAPMQKAEAGFFEDAVGIIAESVGRTVGRKVESAEQDARYGIDHSVYKMCRGVDSDSMREICYDALPRIVDRAIDAARTGATRPTPSTTPSRPSNDRGIVWE